MDKISIGNHAGIIWKILCDNNRWSYQHLKAVTGLPDRDLNAAIGWLARENKIEFEEICGCKYISLGVNIYIG